MYEIITENLLYKWSFCNICTFFLKATCILRIFTPLSFMKSKCQSNKSISTSRRVIHFLEKGRAFKIKATRPPQCSRPRQFGGRTWRRRFRRWRGEEQGERPSKRARARGKEFYMVLSVIDSEKEGHKVRVGDESYWKTTL